MILLADAILAVHLAFVVFVIAGFAAVPAGAALGWRWVRSRPLRLSHLGAIALVALEALLGIACPLTVWEDALRGRGTDAGFVARLVHRLLFYDLPEWVFTAVYLGLALSAFALWRAVPPERRAGRRPVRSRDEKT